MSVIWTEDELRFKARFDYLKPRAIVDLKTFANTMNKPIDAAIYSAMASGKYHIQASFYLRAAEQAKRLCLRADHCEETVFFDDKSFLPAFKHFCQEFGQCEEHGFYFVFQQKGIAPLARGKKYERGLVHGAAEAAIEQAIQRYKDCIAKYGSEPWVDDAQIDSLYDEHYPPWTCDI